MHGFRNLVAACLAVISPGVMADALPAGFATPADTSKPHTWWHWMNGHAHRRTTLFSKPTPGGMV